MAALLYRCPYTGKMVQTLIADAADAPANTKTFETVRCAACSGIHLVSSTGEVLSTRGPTTEKSPA